jgi:hypothetical protein
MTIYVDSKLSSWNWKSMKSNLLYCKQQCIHLVYIRMSKEWVSWTGIWCSALYSSLSLILLLYIRQRCFGYILDMMKNFWGMKIFLFLKGCCCLCCVYVAVEMCRKIVKRDMVWVERNSNNIQYGCKMFVSCCSWKYRKIIYMFTYERKIGEWKFFLGKNNRTGMSKFQFFFLLLFLSLLISFIEHKNCI